MPLTAYPWKRALEKGCDRVAVVLTRERSYRRKAKQLVATDAGMLPQIP